jgi:5-methylthioadenosine/S-adenosylhomocysteine deaminase
VTKLLVKNGYVVTVDGARAVFPEGYILIEGSRISKIGSMAELPAGLEADETIDASGCILLPGLINAHQHHWYTLFKGLADGYLLEDWFSSFVFPIVRHLDDEAMRLAAILPRWRCLRPEQPALSIIP